MNAKHTPGPWKVHAPGKYSPTVSDWVITGGVSPDPVTNARYLEVARVSRTRSDNPMWRQDEDAPANAALFAAAPDLLEACEAACELLVELGADGEPGDMPSPTLEEIRAAIAKARGE